MIPDPGSGRFVPDRVWSCPIHDRPEYHDCDCQFCTWEQPACCQLAKWEDQIGPDGEIVMRELGAFEAMMLDTMKRDLKRLTDPSPFIERLISGPKGDGSEVVWLEDEQIPPLRSQEGS